MKKKNTKRDNVNLFFSAFLITGYIVVSYFCLQLTSTINLTASSIIKIALFVIFGLLLFYATRVGDGKPVFRLSLFTLVLLDIPALYVIIASFASGFPLHQQISGQEYLLVLACIALGYGIPYTFLSGFELVSDEVSDKVLEGGIIESITSEDEEQATDESLGVLDEDSVPNEDEQSVSDDNDAENSEE